MFNKVDFFTTIMFLLVLGSMIIFKLPEGTPIDVISKTNIAIITSITLMMVMNSAMQSFGMSFFEMKNSVLLKRIGATKISKFEAIGSFMLWGFTTMFITLGWIFIWVGIFQIPKVGLMTNWMLYVSPDIWANVNWAGFIIAIFITSLAFYAIAFLFVSVNKNSESYQITSTFYFFLAVFLGGTFTPTSSREWMTIVSYLSPLGWGTDLAISSMLGGNIFNLSAGSLNVIESGSQFEAIGRFVFPIIYGISAGLASIYFFKWD